MELEARARFLSRSAVLTVLAYKVDIAAERGAPSTGPECYERGGEGPFPCGVWHSRTLLTRQYLQETRCFSVVAAGRF